MPKDKEMFDEMSNKEILDIMEGWTDDIIRAQVEISKKSKKILLANDELLKRYEQ